MTLLAQAFSSAVDSFVIACLDLVPSTKPVFLWSLCLGKAMMYIRNSRQSPAQGFGQVAKVEGSSSLASCELSLIFKWRLRLVLRVGPRPIYRSSRKRSCSII